jgi:hypothetical protein
MIPSNPTTSVSWSSTAAPVAAAVPAVVAVAPSAPAARDTRSSLEHGSGRQSPQASARPAVDTAPGEPVRKAADLALQRQAEVELRAQELERLRQRQEAQRETVEQLRQTLRQVWDASASVVDQALQREAEAARAQEAVNTARSKSLDVYEGPAVARDPAGSHVSRRV